MCAVLVNEHLQDGTIAWNVVESELDERILLRENVFLLMVVVLDEPVIDVSLKTGGDESIGESVRLDACLESRLSHYACRLALEVEELLPLGVPQHIGDLLVVHPMHEEVDWWCYEVNETQ